MPISTHHRRLGTGLIVTALLAAGMTAAPAAATGFANDDANQEWLTVLQNDVLEFDAGYLTLNDDASDPVVTGVSGAQHGTVSLNNGRVRFVPTKDSTASGSFTYTATNGDATASAQVTVDVTQSANCPDLAGAFDSDIVVAGTWTRCTDASAHDAGTTVGGSWEDDAALMTTGLAATAEAPVDDQTLGKAWNTSGASEGHGAARDVSTFKLSIDVPADQNCVTLDYAMGSDEPGESNPSPDGFVLSVGSDTWSRQSELPTFFGEEIVTHPAFEPGDLLNETLTPAPNGTGYARLLPQRTLTFGLGPGLRSLYFSVYDGPLGNNPDANVDTSVLLDNLRLSHDDEGCESPINQLPTAADDTFDAYAGEPTKLMLLRGASDLDGDSLTIDEIVSGPSHGDVACDSTSCDYTPDPGFTSDDELVYRVTDGQGGYDTATITINVHDNPVAGIAAVSADGTSATVEVQRTSGSPASGVEVEMLAGTGHDPTTVVATGTTASNGRVTLGWTPPSAGTYYVVFRVAANHAVATDEFPVAFDPDPITAVTVDGPTIIPCNTTTTYSIRATRQSGAAITSGSAGVEVEELTGGWPTVNDIAEFSSEGVATYEIDPVTALELCGAELALTFSVGPKSKRIEVTLSNDGIRGLAMIGATRQVTWPGQVSLLGAVSASGIDPSTVPITLTFKPHGAAVPSALMTDIRTNSDGLLPVQAVRPDTRTTYQWEATAYAKRSQEWTIEVRPLVSFNAARGKGKSRKYVLVSGRSTPVAQGAQVRLERRIGSGSWKLVATTRFTRASVTAGVSRGAPYSFKVKRTKKKAQYRVTIPAQSGRLAVTSSSKTVR